jgi:DNA polymerase III delta prime subunit
MTEWTYKHQPRNPSEYAGSKGNIQMLINFLDNFFDGRPLKNCILFYGKPGNGKSSLPYSLEDHYNLNIVEVNASDKRNARDIRKIFDLTTYNTIGGKRIVLLMDEVDGINAWEEIKKLIQRTKAPIVMTCNDVDKIPWDVQKLCITQEIQYPNVQNVVKRLLQICRQEVTDIDEVKLRPRIEQIAIRCSSMRSAVITLQKCVISKSFRCIIPEDEPSTEYQQLMNLFNGVDMDYIDVTPDTIMKYAIENGVPIHELDKLSKLGKEYPNMVDIVNQHSLTIRSKTKLTKLKSPFFRKFRKTKIEKEVEKTKEYKPRKKKKKEIEKAILPVVNMFDGDDPW